jgi:hypothetical protein
LVIPGEAAALEIALPPFAGLQGKVALPAEDAGKRGRFVHEAVHDFAPCGELRIAESRNAGLIAFAERRIVGSDAVLVGVLTGQNRGEAGTAQTRRDVAAAET